MILVNTLVQNLKQEDQAKLFTDILCLEYEMPWAKMLLSHMLVQDDSSSYKNIKWRNRPQHIYVYILIDKF